MDSFKIFSEEKLPDKKCFYSSVKDEATGDNSEKLDGHINNENYLMCKKIWNEFNMKNMGYYRYSQTCLNDQYQASMQASAQPAVFLFQNFRYFPAFYIVILVKYTVLFILDKYLMDSEQVILIFTEVWSYNFHVSQ